MNNSLAKKTRVYIDTHPSIKDCMSKGLINYSSLSRMIIKDLNLDNGKAVMIACKRYVNKLKSTSSFESCILKILKDSYLEFRTKACIITAKNDWVILQNMNNLFKDLWNKNSFMQIVQSTSALTIIADKTLKNKIIDAIGHHNIIKVKEGFAEIVVRSPEKIIDTSGVVAYLVTNLSNAGINIEEAVSCYTDTIFIVDESNIIDAYSVIADCIQNTEE
ncbi:MAG: ACT domain-containing protein [archaeon]|nr:ACT domain-containing protein [archaeon]